MAEHHQPPGDADLERSLMALGRQVAFPATPPLARRVQQRLAAAPARRYLLDRSWPRRLAFGVAALVVALLVVLVAVPGARTALAGRLGLPGIEIRQVPGTFPQPVTATPPAAPTAGPATSAVTAGAVTRSATPKTVAPATPSASPEDTATAAPTATPLPLGQRLHLGQQVTLAAAQQRVAFPVLLPTSFGLPDAVYLGATPPGGDVTLVYRPQAGLPATAETGVGMLLGEFQGRTDQVFISKMAGPGTTVTPVRVAGQPGFWLSGQPHQFLYQDASGVAHELTLRLAGNTLIWTHGNLTLRLESALSEAAALAIANSVR
jgi:hypothetical protein